MPHADGSATRRRLLTVAGAALAAQTLAKASAQEPGKSIRIIAPNAAGGITDLLGRFAADFIGRETGRTAIVENITGGAGVQATRTIARSTPDGSTLGSLSTGDVLVTQHLFPDMGFDPYADLRPVAMIARAQQLLVVNADLPVRTLREFIAYAKANPSKVNFGSAGTGSITHIGAVQFARLAGLDITHVPYRGAAPAVNDLLSGQIQMMHMSLAPIIAHVRSGKLRILAFASKKRSQFFPDVPTGAEAGLPGYENDVWFALFAPRATPDATVATLNSLIGRMVDDDAVRKRMLALFLEPAPMSPADFEAYLATEAPRWKRIVEEAHIKM
jgi:tripartite-type tricarboxylate transporter receptor subunit TctC